MMKGTIVTAAHAMLGWALCGLTMFLARKLTTPEAALILHALAVPFIFTGISLMYFRRPGSASPLRAAAAFLGIVVFLDLFVVAWFIERSVAMFGSFVGTWLPFALIFLATWWTGRSVRRAAAARHVNMGV